MQWPAHPLPHVLRGLSLSHTTRFAYLLCDIWIITANTFTRCQCRGHSRRHRADIFWPWPKNDHVYAFSVCSFDRIFSASTVSVGRPRFQPHREMQGLPVHGHASAGDHRDRPEEDLPTLRWQTSFCDPVRLAQEDSGLLSLYLQENRGRQTGGLPLDVRATGQRLFRVGLQQWTVKVKILC